MNEKKKALMHKLILLAIAVIFIGLSFLDDSLISIAFVLVLMFFAGCFCISYKEVEYEGKKISAYGGWIHHTLRIDGELYDEETATVVFVPIKLHAVIDENNTIEVKFATRITIKINGKVCK